MTDNAVYDGGLAIEASFDSVLGVLALRGELTGERKETLDGAVAYAVERGVKVVRLDLGQVSFMDSSGLSQLLIAQQQIGAHDARVQLANVPPRIAKVMKVTQTDSIFDIADH